MNSRINAGRGTSRPRSMRCLCALLTASAIALPQFAGAAGEETTSPAITYGLPSPGKVSATQAEIDQLDMDTAAMVDQLRSGSPTAVEYAERAHGVLIFPRVETANYFLLGETNALGVLYVKGETGAYEKAGYYFGQRDSLGFHTGSQTSSRLFMFMKEETLQDFRAGEVTAKFMTVNPETGEITGDPDADIAAFITNVEGDVSGVSFRGLKIRPVEFVK